MDYFFSVLMMLIGCLKQIEIEMQIMCCLVSLILLLLGDTDFSFCGKNY